MMEPVPERSNPAHFWCFDSFISKILRMKRFVAGPTIVSVRVLVRKSRLVDGEEELLGSGKF